MKRKFRIRKILNKNKGIRFRKCRVDKRKRIHHHKRWMRFRLSTLHLPRRGIDVHVSEKQRF
uniref:Uncharacterized protein n=1 Tax=Candidatus Kentrum sp. SD TaxID=2126332 RepID=A0A450YHZ6_9GAMM|nr:MAG: hypothetical protein BECKSD772F_GA0070984_101025 [Candidatus Kentron sp. SD]VFK41177.1 MAG: hypothetical protein BECKSD772E_GA0070983_101023 [Candidatus Kentron sp. SD]VFK78287.1 MAG: hypothetical protein BECKSD772D_GA0070982_101118 [Candidatus Kentron sp. SD]